MTIENVEQALIQAYTNANLGMQTAYENTKFAPPINGVWAMLSFLPNAPTGGSLGDNGLDLFTGIFQINLNGTLDKGVKDLKAKSDALRAIYKAGASFTYNGQVVTVRSCGRSPGRAVDKWYRYSVSVGWYAFVQR